MVRPCSLFRQAQPGRRTSAARREHQMSGRPARAGPARSSAAAAAPARPRAAPAGRAGRL